ncbi:MAG: L-threonylcarbamoyladenylate synthase [Lachnospiraceae bacterium]|nr:threonylcarbamoyl-AMP synthase [Robinsoniella sp.]MDY3765607.1 L-threonylcarbamoyladenylate synthase [Lachnospiraceae bacterium]
METKIVRISEDHEEQWVKEAGQILKNGGLVAFPTETVYGLGANALDEKAAAKIYAAKGRPSDNPLIVHIADFSDLEKIVEKVPEEAVKLAKAFWPGPLTMIMRKNDKVPYGTTGGLETVAVRMPSDEVAQKLIRSGGGYIAAPSANTSGRPSPTSAAHVIEDLNGKIDMILDGGSVGIGLESTIIDLSEDVPTILRPGFITQKMMSDIIGKVEIDAALIKADSNIRPKAPGMKYRHYAPKANMILVRGDREKVAEKIRELVRQELDNGGKPGVLCADETASMYSEGIIKKIGTLHDELTISRHLYGVLRDFDEEGVSSIFSETFETPMLGTAIMNRLKKAAGQQLIEV